MNWTLIIVILFSVAIILVAAVLIMAMARTQEKNKRRAFTLEVNNTGNATTRYELWADDPSHALQFEFMLNRITMGQPVGQNLLATAPTRSTPRPPGNTYTQGAPKPGGVGGIGGIIAELADTLGHLLPGSAGYSILQVSERIRMGQSAVTRTQRSAEQVERLGSKVGKLGGQTHPGAASQSAATGGMQAVQGSMSASAGGGTLTRPQTPVVEAGKVLKLDLVVRPAVRLKTNKVPFAILSRSLDQPDVEPLSEPATAIFPGLTGIAAYIPYVVIGATAVIMIVVIVIVTHPLG